MARPVVRGTSDYSNDGNFSRSSIAGVPNAILCADEPVRRFSFIVDAPFGRGHDRSSCGWAQSGWKASATGGISYHLGHAQPIVAGCWYMFELAQGAESYYGRFDLQDDWPILAVGIWVRDGWLLSEWRYEAWNE